MCTVYPLPYCHLWCVTCCLLDTITWLLHSLCHPWAGASMDLPTIFHTMENRWESIITLSTTHGPQNPPQALYIPSPLIDAIIWWFCWMWHADSVLATRVYWSPMQAHWINYCSSTETEEHGSHHEMAECQSQSVYEWVGYRRTSYGNDQSS